MDHFLKKFLPPVGKYDLDFSRFVFYAILFVFFWDRHFDMYVDLPKFLFKRSPLFDILNLPPPGYWIIPLSIIWKISIFTTAIGLFTRYSAIVCFVLGFYLLGLDWCYARIHHYYHVLVVCMGIFASANLGQYFSIDSLSKKKPEKLIQPVSEAWPLRYCQLCLCLMYFSAGLAKLRVTGLDFIFSDTMKTHLIYSFEKRAHRGNSLQHFFNAAVAGSPFLYKTLAALAIGFEILFPIALFSIKWRWFFLALIAAMHLGIFLTMYILFKDILPIFAVMIPWTLLYEKLKLLKTRILARNL